MILFILCEIRIIVLFLFVCNDFSNCIICCLFCGLSFVVGLLIMIILGFIVNIDIIVILCICLFDIWNGDCDIIFFEKFKFINRWWV